MLNYEQEMELGRKLTIWTTNELNFVNLRDKGFDGTYIYEQTKGGRQVIVGSDGKVLSFVSAVSLDRVLDDIKNNNVWVRAVDPKSVK